MATFFCDAEKSLILSLSRRIPVKIEHYQETD